MFRNAKTIALAVLLAALCSRPGLGQGSPTTILRIVTENSVAYLGDISDVSRFATDPGIVNRGPSPRNFAKQVILADIVSVNGQPARGTLVFNIQQIILSPAPNAGEAVADITRNGVIDQIVEILKTDGTPVGTIMALGLTMGSPPPGSPLALIVANNAIVGGTGAFLGVRGQWGATTVRTPIRMSSMTEDPANRRRNGGGRNEYVLHVIPMSRPEVVITPNGPAVSHSNDFALVSTSRPAAAGEILSAFVTGLGPTVPGVDPGSPFPASPLAAVNSPVEVTVNGRPAEVLAAVGYPGTTDNYQVNFRVPTDTAKGTATVQVSAAWIAGSEVRIAIQ